MKKPVPTKSAQSRRRPAPRRAPVRRRKASGSIGQQLALMVFCIGLLAIALPTALLLAFALLPLCCAFITDRSAGRSATICVGSLNFAGTWPFLLLLWTHGHTVTNAMEIMLDPYSWLVIYCAAAVGWLLYLSFPSLVSASMSLFAGHRLAQLRQQQKHLIAEWGNEVSGGRRGS